MNLINRLTIIALPFALCALTGSVYLVECATPNSNPSPQRAIEKRWAGKPIPEGYKEYTHGHYKYHTTPKNWNNARETCISEGAHLAVVNSESEARLLASILPSDKFAWIGTHDFYQEGQWVTIFDQSLEAAGYNKWVRNEPNGGTTENCGDITKHDGRLGNYFCNKKLTFFCELQ